MLKWFLVCVLVAAALATEDGPDEAEVVTVYEGGEGEGLGERMAAAIDSTPAKERPVSDPVYGNPDPEYYPGPQYPAVQPGYPGHVFHPHPHYPPHYPYRAAGSYEEEDEDEFDESEYLQKDDEYVTPHFYPGVPHHVAGYAAAPVPTCNLKAMKRCQCVSPPEYDSKGQGNCNVGATRLNLRVWCYVDAETAPYCPDAVVSRSKKAKKLSWSRLACITG